MTASGCTGVHKRGAHAVAIRRNAVREGGQRVLSSRGDPGVELVYRTGANHGVKAIEQVACGDQRRHTLLDESHGRSEGDGDAIAHGRQKSSDHPCRWWFSRSPIGHRRFIETAPLCPFGDDAAGSCEACIAQSAPDLAGVVASCAPISIERGEMRLQGAHAASEHVGAAAANDPPNGHPRQTESSDDFFDRRAHARQGEDGVGDFLSSSIALPLPPLGAGERRRIDDIRVEGLTEEPAISSGRALWLAYQKLDNHEQDPERTRRNARSPGGWGYHT